MEEEFERTDNVHVKQLDFPELRRVRSLDEDMEYYFGQDWKNVVVPSDATRTYCNRIRTIARNQPHLLVAHMYTRYIGDLFGGQIMKGMARASLKLDKGKGTRFYEFDDISSIKPFIEAWYTKLNELDLSDQEKKEIVNEANHVFALNLGLFQEIGPRKKMTWSRAAALVRLVRSRIQSQVKLSLSPA
jgi:heme oxygenase